MVCGPFLALLLLEHLLEQTEGDGGLGGGAALADDDDAEAVTLDEVHEVVQVVLADVVAGKNHLCALAGLEGGEVVGECFHHGLGAEVTAADAYGDHIVALLAQRARASLEGAQLRLVDARRQVEPSQEVVAGTSAVLKFLYCSLSGWS